MMARPGITYNDVVSAAQHLQGTGQNITIEEIRRYLGTGSSSTIAPYLRKWRNQQDETTLIATKEKIPQELISLVKGLWERVVNQADERLVALKQSSQQEISQLKNELKQLTDDNVQLQHQYHNLKHNNQQLIDEKLRLENELYTFKSETDRLNLQQEGLIKQLQEKQHRVEELNRLHNQVQSNLEHYREAAREERLIDQERHAKLQKQSELTIESLTQNLTILNQESTSLKKEHEQTVRKKCEIEDSYHHCVQENNQLRHHLTDLKKTHAEAIQTKQHLQNQYGLLLKQNEQQNIASIEFQKQIAVLSEQLSYVKNENEKLANLHQSTVHEKWVIVQEKSQLEGQLQQLLKIMS